MRLKEWLGNATNYLRELRSSRDPDGYAQYREKREYARKDAERGREQARDDAEREREQQRREHGYEERYEAERAQERTEQADGPE